MVISPKVPDSGADPKWVQDMRAHFLRTGAYRATDLQRVLGDPRASVGGGPAHSGVGGNPVAKDKRGAGALNGVKGAG